MELDRCDRWQLSRLIWNRLILKSTSAALYVRKSNDV